MLRGSQFQLIEIAVSEKSVLDIPTEKQTDRRNIHRRTDRKICANLRDKGHMCAAGGPLAYSCVGWVARKKMSTLWTKMTMVRTPRVRNQCGGRKVTENNGAGVANPRASDSGSGQKYWWLSVSLDNIGSMADSLVISIKGTLLLRTNIARMRKDCLHADHSSA